jgi:hypothetical protein
MNQLARYYARRSWTADASMEHVQAALIFGDKGSLLARVVSDEVGRLVMRLGSRGWFFMGAGLFTPNALVPMTVVIDLKDEGNAVTIDANAMSNLPDWLIPRPGDRGRYEDSFERLFSNLITATSS